MSFGRRMCFTCSFPTWASRQRRSISSRVRRGRFLWSSPSIWMFGFWRGFWCVCARRGRGVGAAFAGTDGADQSGGLGCGRAGRAGVYSTLVGRFDRCLLGMLAALLRLRPGRWLLWWRRWRRYGWPPRYMRDLPPNFARAAPVVFWAYLSTVGAYVGRRGAGVSRRGHCVAAVAGALAGARRDLELFALFMARPCAVRLHRAVGGWQPFASVAANALLHFALALPVCLGVAWLSFTTIEQPFLRLRGRYVQ